MDVPIFDPRTLEWALGLIIGFPLAMLLASEAILRLRRRGLPIADTLAILRNLVLPTLALLILLRQVVGLPSDRAEVRIVELLMWIFLLHASLSFVNDVVFASAEEGSWRARFPKLLLDMVRLILVLIGGSVILWAEWGINPTSLFTALGVGSIVIGLALQEPLGNVFAGLMLLFERPLALGDWIQIDGITGEVVEINWRSVRIATDTRELRIVPNSSLYKGSFSNLSRPDKIRTEVVELGFPGRHPPNKVKGVLSEVLRGVEGVLDDPPPRVRAASLDEATVVYRAIFSVARQEDLAGARDEFLTRVWYAARREGLVSPPPADGLAEQLRSFPLFRAARDDLVESYGSEIDFASYARGEQVLTEGERRPGLFLMLSGQASMTVRDESGREQPIVRLGRGEFFGEGSLLSGQPSEVSVAALEDLEVLVLRPDAVQALLEESPRLGREIGTIMDIRRRAARSARRARDRPPTSRAARSR